MHFLSQPIVDGTTGNVIVLTTPDAQRTMLSYQVIFPLSDIKPHSAVMPLTLQIFVEKLVPFRLGGG